MRLALHEATLAPRTGDVPVGAVVLSSDGTVIGRGRNEREAVGDPTAHAEVLAIREASRTAGSWRLGGCTLVVTLEPCTMCAGAVVLSRLDRVVYGALDEKSRRGRFALGPGPRPAPEPPPGSDLRGARGGVR